MEVIPAVDIMKGRVVRLRRGDPKTVKSYEKMGSPVALARRWEADGARTIHIVDLDQALDLGSNLDVIEDIVKAVKTSVQVGGGIRTLEAARALLNTGVDKIIVGSLAFQNPSSIETLLEKFGENHIIVALDHLKGTVMTNGWKMSTRTTVDDGVSKFSRLGVSLFLVTSVARDGTMTGPDVETLRRICRPGVRIMTAGGIRNVDDLVALKRLGAYGVVVGRALYEGSFDLHEALRITGGGGPAETR